MSKSREHLIITQYPMDGTDASTIHGVELARHLAALGEPIRVICPRPRRRGCAIEIGAPTTTLSAFGSGLLRALVFQLSLTAVLSYLAGDEFAVFMSGTLG